ncbi:hypothetical protein FH972_023737 [Carpinus fangiana]|uniref:protein O-GlcNAc transferase n=1 Tax=Carpinus fangiana TaxID=176857 RepID=A0A5N6KWF7_9ROSI|nr:hypothetical protein FH972_023737 [Carpinus fangiana]
MAAQVQAPLQTQQHPPRIFRLDALENHDDAPRSWPRNASSNSRPRPPQFALPLRSTGQQDRPTPMGYAKPFARSETSSDDMLRRKTPAGILSGAYDGAPVGFGLEGVRATKHLVMQDPARQAYNRPQLTQLSTNVIPGHFSTGLKNHFATPASGQWLPPPVNPHTPIPPWFPYTPPSDTRTEQFNGSHGTRALQFDQYGHQQVMQPPLQTPLGPTVSNELGPYGPYWPNGTFVPYRPASARDQQWSQGGFAAPMAQVQAMKSGWGDSNWHGPSQSYGAAIDAPPRPGLHSATQNHHLPHMQNYTIIDPPAARSTGRRPVGSHSQHDNITLPATALGAGLDIANQQNPDPEALLRSAHQLYDHLVATVHSARRHGRRHSQPGTRPLRPDIYPVPSRRSSVNTRNTLAKEDLALHASGEMTPFADPFAAPGSHSQSLQLTHNHNLPHSYLASHAKSQDGLNHNRHQAGTGHPHRRLSQNMNQTFEGFGNLQINAPDLTNPASWNILFTLTSVIFKGGERWVDGMQLAGCMSYMLGDYESALDWNTTILEIEPEHVEVMSNLAATMLALGRRAEAESHWRRVVKFKPSHFEAVEHLVGLLCFDNRHKEAIQIIDFVQQSLKKEGVRGDCSPQSAQRYDQQQQQRHTSQNGTTPTRYAHSAQDNGRMMALIHAKGNVLYNMRDHFGAAKAFEEVVLIAVGQFEGSIAQLIKSITATLSKHDNQGGANDDILLLNPQQALHTARSCFPPHGCLPGLVDLPTPMALRAAVSVTSNSLLSLAKIFQDSMNPNSPASAISRQGCKVQDILALYYLSLSLQPSPSTANNVGILLASVESTTAQKQQSKGQWVHFPGVLSGSGVALALEYYRYGLGLDHKHAHLYTNFGSLLKDIGQLPRAIQMYEQAVACDGSFDIALANLANAVKDQGKVNEAIIYYKRAVEVNPKFAEAVCGLANALNSVCNWSGRGGILLAGGQLDRWHVGDKGELVDAKSLVTFKSGWIKRVVDIVDTQLKEGESWGRNLLQESQIESLSKQLALHQPTDEEQHDMTLSMQNLLRLWVGNSFEGARVVRLVERAIRQITWQWYQDKHVLKKERPLSKYARPSLPPGLTVPSAPTVLPFHTFTFPMTAKQIRLISQRNGLRVSCSTLRQSWLGKTVFNPPAPPSPQLIVGYVSSDFNNHPLAHLMQSVFGMHDTKRVKAICYATTSSDNSIHRQQIEREAPVFHDVSSWSVERIVWQIANDGCHILVNLNGYTRGARNEIFAARPAPIQMSFMGFAGTLGAEWCDYLLADEIAVPPSTLRPHRGNVTIQDLSQDETYSSMVEPENSDWVYAENIVYTRATFFCCDHARSSVPNFPSAAHPGSTFGDELSARAQMRFQLFPDLVPSTVILANFNQLYKIDPTTFRTWLRILGRLPNAILWLLRFPDAGEAHLRRTALAWAGPAVANRIRFTEVAPKAIHISRAAAADLFLDTPECNAHTTAADCLWSGTPLLTLPRYRWKMCSRMAASILAGALGVAADAAGRRAQLRSADPAAAERVRVWDELVVDSEEAYEATAIRLGESLRYSHAPPQHGAWSAGGGGAPVHGQPGRWEGECSGRLAEMRYTLFKARKERKAALFDTRRWVGDLEAAYEEVWARWVRGEGGDVWLRDEKICGEL